MNKLIIFIVSVILVSILGFMSIRTVDNQPKSFFRTFKQLAGLLMIDVLIIFLAIYFHYN
ncbi:Mid2-like cell wall stress sensor domain protein [Phocicoccus pinnipedialis]|uniref:Uncharacterized protein n=1 Tax=Phocicoccus pinnipedialis TaxID=110845 RepID=A0A6V7RI18_9BACL|nr:hypothetical protein [Jeotgalicoccus pinnipedialis]CAD2076977.1 hypothetical protein JEOPIN946_01380 [Jeotgalicoccus pinnipedialis]